MALIRWEPARELHSARSDFDRLFNSVFDTSTFAVNARPTARPFAPALDIVEAESEFIVTADLPGMSEQDVKLTVQDGVLTLSGERKVAHRETQQGYYRLERAAGSFSRSLALPEGVNPEALTANFDRGVLEIHVPKPEARKPRTIEIAVGAGAAPQAQDTIEAAQN
jgi:HSP20 family protein